MQTIRAVVIGQSTPFFPKRCLDHTRFVGGITVRQFSSSEPVRLVKDLPELELRPGQIGVVKNKWETPFMAYEVEFKNGDRQLRVLLLENHLAAA